MFRSLILLVGVIAGTGCTHSIHRVGVSSFQSAEGLYPQAQVKPIEVRTSQKVVLMADNTDYVDEAYKELQQKCADGEVVGVTAQHSTSHGFLSWTNKLLVKGNCVK